MASSATLVQIPTKQTFKVSCADVTVGTYATNGVTVTPAQLGLSTVYFAIATVKSVSGTVNVYRVAQAYYDVANSKIKVFDETPAEALNDSDFTGLVLRVVAFGA